MLGGQEMLAVLVLFQHGRHLGQVLGRLPSGGFLQSGPEWEMSQIPSQRQQGPGGWSAQVDLGRSKCPIRGHMLGKGWVRSACGSGFLELSWLWRVGRKGWWMVAARWAHMC